MNAPSSELNGEEFVRLVLEEVGDQTASAINQIVYLFESCLEDGKRFRFTFQPFLGMHDAGIDGLVQTAKLGLMLGRNGMSPEPAALIRERLRKLLSILPSNEQDLRLVAVADFVDRQGWHTRAKLSLQEMLETALPQFAPDARLSIPDAVDLLRELRSVQSTRQVEYAT